MIRPRPIALLLALAIGTSGCQSGDSRYSTRYAKAYSEDRYRKIRLGMSSHEVVGLLGVPLKVSTQAWSEIWTYGNPASGWVEKTNTRGEAYVVNSNLAASFTMLEYSASGIVKSSSGRLLEGQIVGSSKQEILARFGEPNRREVSPFSVVYHYSHAGKRAGAYEMREVHFDQTKKVISTVAKVYYD